MLENNITVGTKVLVPRTGGGTSIGTVTKIFTHTAEAEVEFSIGNTYRGERISDQKMQNQIGHKIVPIKKLEIINYKILS